MFKIESYVTPILLSYVDKYVRDFKPADAQVSLWGGGVALHNLVLKADVLQQEVALPFTLVSGRIHELLIQVPWTKIMSEPIVVTIDTIECVLSLDPPVVDENEPPEPPRRTQVVEAPPGYMQALVRRVVSNIALRVHHLIVKYVQDDIVLSLNVKHLAVDSAGSTWEPAFADIDQNEPVVRRLVRLDDLTLCLDRADSDGKIRFYQEPLLYRCQLDLRVLTRLVSASTRRASSLSVHVRSSRLAWGATSDQLALLLRLARERPAGEGKPAPPAPKAPAAAQPASMHVTSANSAEPARQESWSEWAWSWLPALGAREGAAEETPAPAAPVPVHLSAYLDDVSLVFKVMEGEGGVRRRARGVLEARAHHAAVRCHSCAPTALRVRAALRTLRLVARGKCVCAHAATHASRDESTVYLRKTDPEDEEPWSWPEGELNVMNVELAEAADELKVEPEADTSDRPDAQTTASEQEELSDAGRVFERAPPAGEVDPLWHKMAPVATLEYSHERSPPHAATNPYESPPQNFQYSDWQELCDTKIQIEPLEVRVTAGLVHRLEALVRVLSYLPPVPEPDLPMRTLTVEECEALLENLPLRRLSVEARELRVRVEPWDHAADRPSDPPLVLDLELPKSMFVLTTPLYPHRVCSAACQMPSDAGPLWQGSRAHVSAAVWGAQARVGAGDERPSRPCARADLRLVAHTLLHPRLFTRESVLLSYSLKIREINVCGSAARLQAAWCVPRSLLSGDAALLRHTSLAHDALHDDEEVAVDVTLEELSLRGYITSRINTHILAVQSARATAFHAPNGGELKQAWVFSAPDVPTTTPYLRAAVQWCSVPLANSLDYAGVWTEPVSFCVDPLFIAWLAYKPTVHSTAESQTSLARSTSSIHYFLRRRTTPPLSTTTRLPSRPGSGAELVHARRSAGSSSEPSERRDRDNKHNKAPAESSCGWWSGEQVVRAHARLKRALASVELGLALLYVPAGSASALDCATVRDAMERHAHARPVLVLSMGRYSMHTNSAKKHLWNNIRHDGPTFISEAENQELEDSFPWKMRLADVSCYTLEPARDRSERSPRSQLKAPVGVTPQTVLELVTTTVTLSVVTKSVLYKTTVKKSRQQTTAEEERVKYFTSGLDFKPSTLKEFFRGPANRKKSSPDLDTAEQKEEEEEEVVKSGPMVSMGVHLHADTPPLIVRIDHEQMHVVASALHGLQHVARLLRRGPSVAARPPSHALYTLQRSVSEQDEIRSPSEDTLSESKDELISIFESKSTTNLISIKTSFWCQWVVSRATLVVATRSVKLAFDADDIICTLDLQPHYNQLKVKVASAAVRHYERGEGSNEWKAGVLEGRVLEAREPTSAMEENHFMAVTITQAQLSNLPANWKEELHPKLLEEKAGVDTMWEIYATLAPLEVVVQPSILENVASLLHEFAPRSFCPLKDEVVQRSGAWQWPFCYVNAGGLRLLLTAEDHAPNTDDTFVVVIGKLTVNPHPENPICRRAVNAGTESSWLGGSAPYEGRQYEALVSKFAVRTAQFSQLVYQETSEKEMLKGTAGENPALKWSQPPVSPTITPLLHAIDIGLVLAPAMYVRGVLCYGPAAELNLVSDCALELSVPQLGLLRAVAADLASALCTSSTTCLLDQDRQHACPYATLLMSKPAAEDVVSTQSDSVLSDGAKTSLAEGSGVGVATDSGVDTAATRSTKTGSRLDDHLASVKKSVSIALVDPMAEPSDYLEVFVTMGVIELSLYVADDGSPELVALRPPQPAAATSTDPPTIKMTTKVIFEEEKPQPSSRKDDAGRSNSVTRSITDTVRKADAGTIKLEGPRVRLAELPQVRKNEGNLPLLHMTLQQPNLYYWKRKNQKNLQVSLFNAWMGLGAGQAEGHWRAPLLVTGRGELDPVTEIPPALLTMNLTAPAASGSTRGALRVAVERPVQVQVCCDRLRRVRGILELVNQQLPKSEEIHTGTVTLPFLYRLRRSMVSNSIESISIETSQLSVAGGEGAVGCEGVTLQAAAGARSDRLTARALVQALLVASAGTTPATAPEIAPEPANATTPETATETTPTTERRAPLLPLTLGLEMEASWEAWRRVEGGRAACEPTVRVAVDVDRVTVELRPEELAALRRVHDALREFMPDTKTSAESASTRADCAPPQDLRRTSQDDDHYYKDDLRSGAFKIVSGGQLPMAYQVTLHGPAVAWRYPHPRAITRLVAFPLPGQEEEIECVLELFSPMAEEWQPHTYFKLPVDEPRELMLYATPPDAVFAQMWRFRAVTDREQRRVPFEFRSNRFWPRVDPLTFETPPEMDTPPGSAPVTAEQLSGVIRVDSYFAPRALPRLRVTLRLANADLHLHNSQPALSSDQTKMMEGYYVSRPLMRSHRVLTLTARDCTAYAHLGSPVGYKLMCDAALGSDVLDCATGTMQPLIEEFRVQTGLSVPDNEPARARVRCSGGAALVSLHVPRINTLLALATDYRQYLVRNVPNNEEASPVPRSGEVEPPASLKGRVSLWIHNTCACALRVGQEGTDEMVPLGPGTLLAYRWRNPTAPKKLRLAIAGPPIDWHWSTSIPFIVGTYRVRLEDADTPSSSRAGPGAGVHVHVTVGEGGGARRMRLAGRLLLANMLRRPLVYKVRAQCPDASQWRSICTGELAPESVGPSVVCGAYSELSLKIKFASQEVGWSGDIPLKECPKENVPWLVKVPCEGEVPYVSVWCRVVRARSDGRVLAAVWPLYVLRSHLPLDADVLIATEPSPSAETEPDSPQPPAPPLVQTAPGRGASTHLLAPGTTQARHHLSFQYRDIECPVTREAVPLHYGVTDASVFDRRAPAHTVDEVVAEIHDWLGRSGQGAASPWPFSIVTRHWPGVWQPALLQPRCDVTMRYGAVRAGGGCGLELQLCPVVVLCNAAPIPLTLRAHDAAPLCKLEPGAAISPASAVLKKPFFISVELGRETFVSGQLAVSDVEPGRYGAPAPGHVALDRAAGIAIHCSQKVALLTMYYEIKQDINVLGVSTTYELLNRLGTDILVSAIAVPNDAGPVTLRPKTLQQVEPIKQNSIHGTPLCRFWLMGRWHSGGDPSELMLFLCVALPADGCPAAVAVPVRLGEPPFRRAISLVDHQNRPVAVVVTQQQHEGRWLVGVAADPCPQYVLANRTSAPIAVAQPQHAQHYGNGNNIQPEAECAGARWHATVPADGCVHYSSPAHCERYPPPAAPRPSAAAAHTAPQLLTFARLNGENLEGGWCPPVCVTDGEQLVQLAGGVTVKLRARTHPHSTLLELQPVDQNDISASDIRKRLLEPFISNETLDHKRKVPESAGNIEREHAEEKLLRKRVSSTSVDIGLVHSDAGREGRAEVAGGEEQDSSAPSKESSTTLILKDHEADAETIVDSIAGNELNKISILDADMNAAEWEASTAPWPAFERARCVLEAVVVELAAAADVPPLVALHLDRAALLVCADGKRTQTTLSVSGIQIDNLQYASGQYDFGVIACTSSSSGREAGGGARQPLWSLLAERGAFSLRPDAAGLLVCARTERWHAVDALHEELTEVEISLGPLALYIEDAYVSALVQLARTLPSASDAASATSAASEAASVLSELRALEVPLRLQLLHIKPLTLTLTLHTAVRMYIALDQSPLRLGAFKLQRAMTSVERLTHALTVHYLSSVILGAGWVVGGLELLGAPGALAARVGGASGGVRGVASAAAAALVRSLSAWAGSLARNLDLLAGDEEHARRAAAARRRPPPSFVAGLMAGFTNFAINILGAVGGLAHHPLVGVAVGESESGATALRRGLLGALTKPLSATADLLAYAGHGLLTQAGWDPVPQPRPSRWSSPDADAGAAMAEGEGAGRGAGWRRDCVRWSFRLAELVALDGYEVLLDHAPLMVLLTHKFLVVADAESEKIVEMIELKFCTLAPYRGQIIELNVLQKRPPKFPDSNPVDEDDEYQLNVAAMARVARYTGATGAGQGAGPGPGSGAGQGAGPGGAGAGAGGGGRVVRLLPAPGRAHALHAALAALVHSNCDAHLPLL